MDDDLQWKTTYNGRKPTMEENLKIVKVEYLGNHCMHHDLWVRRGKLEESSEEILSVALLSPACLYSFFIRNKYFKWFWFISQSNCRLAPGSTVQCTEMYSSSILPHFKIQAKGIYVVLPWTSFKAREEGQDTTVSWHKGKELTKKESIL